VAVDYRRQYAPEQLEPLWPNGCIRLAVASLCALSVMIFVAVLPVILDYFGLGHWMEEPEPADRQVTPSHIRPEWYFLAVYQTLKLFPSEFLGVSGKTLGVLSQGAGFLLIALLPFWPGRARLRPPGTWHMTAVTLVIAAFVALTLWGAWPPTPVLTLSLGAVVLLFYVLVIGERRRIRRSFADRRDEVT
jgi:quinol-cytochrome oxidoreductase complex cytochrome b subunit